MFGVENDGGMGGVGADTGARVGANNGCRLGVQVDNGSDVTLASDDAVGMDAIFRGGAAAGVGADGVAFELRFGTRGTVKSRGIGVGGAGGCSSDDVLGRGPAEGRAEGCGAGWDCTEVATLAWSDVAGGNPLLWPQCALHGAPRPPCCTSCGNSGSGACSGG